MEVEVDELGGDVVTIPLEGSSSTEIRKDYLLDRWVIIAPSRASRPEILSQESEVEYDPESNPFCEGHEDQTPGELFAIAEGPREKDQPGWKVRVFPNAYPALQKAGPVEIIHKDGLTSLSGVGRHELIVDCPEFEDDFCQLPASQMRHVLETYRVRMAAAYCHAEVKFVQVFKNQGAAAGASLPHAHSQLLTFPMIPPMVQQEISACESFYNERKQYFFNWLIEHERRLEQRVIYENAEFMVLAPFGSRFAFEAWIIPKRHAASYTGITAEELRSMSEVLSKVLKGLSGNISRPSFNLVLHSIQEDNPQAKYYCWHLEILPRISGLAGFEMGTGCYVNSIFPEAATKLYKKRICKGI